MSLLSFCLFCLFFKHNNGINIHVVYNNNYNDYNQIAIITIIIVSLFAHIDTHLYQ